MVKILETDFASGFVKLAVNDKLDLWNLEKIIVPGDFVIAKSPRHTFVQREDGKEKSAKKLVEMKIEVEKVEFSEGRDKLRIKGKIVECPKEVPKGYHTIEIGLGSRMEIQKRWTDEQIKRLERAQQRMPVSDAKSLEDFFLHINKDDGLAVYGFEQVKAAAEMGAVKTVLVPEEKIREKETEELVKVVEDKSGEVRLVLSRSKIEKEFCKNYGIGAMLRFKVS